MAVRLADYQYHRFAIFKSTPQKFAKPIQQE
jgi:hypothetical protein